MNLNAIKMAKPEAWPPPIHTLFARSISIRNLPALKSILMRINSIKLLLIIGLLQASASVVFGQVTLKESHAPLEKVLHIIEKQTGYVFLYTGKDVQSLTVSVEVSNVPVNEALDKCLKDLPLSYKVLDKNILLKRKEVAPLPQNKPANPIDKNIRGNVVDTTGAAIPNATITVKNSSFSSTADNKGEFTLTVQDNAILVISSIGFESKEVALSSEYNLRVVLHQSMSKLDEVHVIAYGTSTQRISVGSISKVTSTDIQQQPVTNPLAVLEGRVPGLSITASSGIPGSSFTVQIRGQNTLNSALGSLAPKDQPLFIIDGVPFAAQNDNLNQFQSVMSPGLGVYYNNRYGGVSPFNSINPADIESIEVLKDADATAIYGSRGGNGVILVTTKKGKIGKTGLDITVDDGISTVPKAMPMMNTQEYLAMRREAFANDKLTPSNIVGNRAYAPDLTVFDQNRYTDWRENFIGNTAHHLNTNAAVSGGNENTQFRIAGGFNQDTYIFPGDYKDNRASFSSNIHHSSNDKKFTLDFTTNYSYDANNSSSSLNLLTAFKLEPNYPDPLDSYGNLIWNYKGASLTGSYAGLNPMTFLKQGYSVTNTSLNANLLLSYQLFRGLTFRTNTGYGTFGSNEFSSFPIVAQNPAYNPTASANFGTNDLMTWIIEPQLEYKNSFKKAIYTILAGGTFQKKSDNTTQVQGSGYINDDLLNSISGSATQIASDQSTLYKYTAIFARFNVRWDGKYIVDLNARRDGSSRFGPDRQFGNFGSAAAGWIFSEEKFIKKQLPILIYGKLRASYGITGSDQIGDYNFISRYAPTSYSYNGTLGYLPQNLANDQFGWATTKKLEIGLELGFVQDRLLLSSSWYRNRSGNQLISYLLPDQSGFNSVIKNSPALVQNTGWEFTLQAKIITHKDFSWNTSLNATIPRNKLLAFPGLATSSYSTTYLIGRPVGEILGFKSAGVNPTTGLFQFYDATGKIVATPKAPSGNSLNDFYDLGSRDPKFYGGLANNISYKNVQLSFFFEYRKQLGINYLSQLYGTPGGEINQPEALIDSHWKSPGDNASFQKYAAVYGPAATALANYKRSDGVYSDASYLRLKTVSVSYLILSKVLSKMDVKSLRVYVNAQNIFTITGYKGNDPETQNFYGVPTLRTITGGLQLTF